MLKSIVITLGLLAIWLDGIWVLSDLIKDEMTLAIAVLVYFVGFQVLLNRLEAWIKRNGGL